MSESKCPPPVNHPRLGEGGRRVTINCPTLPSAQETWYDPQRAAVFVPDSPVPSQLNGIPIFPFDPPSRANNHYWSEQAGAHDREAGRSVCDKAGIVLLEAAPDGRVWVVEPTNGFPRGREYEKYMRYPNTGLIAGEYLTFPKGGLTAGLSVEGSALKELYEETGFVAEIKGVLCQCKRGQSVVRFYWGSRKAGTPSAMDWESQAVWLLPFDQLVARGHNKDRMVIEAVRALRTRL